MGAMKRILAGMAGIAALCIGAVGVEAEVRLHSLFTDGAVLQRDKPVPVWGTARDGEKVTVSLGSQKAVTTARDGKWMVNLKPMKAGGPFALIVQGDNAVTVNDVLVGEVWVCSGQSNMEWPVWASAEPQATINASADPQMRLFQTPRRAEDFPLENVDAKWMPCEPKNVSGFSAVAYFFGRDLRKALNVPVGLIQSAVGGSPAEAWMRPEILEGNSDFRSILDNHARARENHLIALSQYTEVVAQHRLAADRARAAGKEPPKMPPPPDATYLRLFRPSGLYHGMIAPLIPYAIRGAIWYQGESNAGRAWQYRALFPAMIQNWRDDWGQGDFPFYFVQLAPFMKIEKEPKESAWAELRDSQRLTARHFPHTGMAVITDAGDEDDIHPKAKQPVGERLARLARARVYKQKIVATGPTYEGMKVQGNRAVLRFGSVGSGLAAKGGDLTGFTIAGPDRRFVSAKAEIQGNTVVVSSPEVAKPVAVRYGWANYPVVNLVNSEGLPASPFRTDEFPWTTAPK